MNSWIALLLGVGGTGGLRADDLTLAGQSRLTGTVRSINEAGVVELSSALSPDSVFLKADAVAMVNFRAPEVVPNPPGTLIELSNGDLLPAAIEGLDERNLVALTADAGRLVIPRTALKSIQLGVRQRQIIYTGPRNLEEWSRHGDGVRGWTFANKSLVASGPGRVSKQFEAPSQFTFKFTLKWQGSPSFQVYFADPLTPNVDPVDRYYLQFNGAGLEVKRESSQGQHFQTVIIPSVTPEKYPTNEVDVEIRVDRKTSRLDLFLNGEAEGAGVDPVAKPPAGNGVTFVSSAPAGATQEIRGIEVSEFDNTRVRHRSEDRGNPAIDSLISRDDDRWSGHLTRIQGGAEGTVFSFKSDFHEEPLELSEADVSTIFFAKPDQEAAPVPPGPFVLRLRGEGLLHVSSCTLAGEDVSAQHPLLGMLKINRTGISALERPGAKPAAKSAE